MTAAVEKLLLIPVLILFLRGTHPYISVYRSHKTLVQHSLSGSSSLKPEWYNSGLVINHDHMQTMLWCGVVSRFWIRSAGYGKKCIITNIVVTLSVSLKCAGDFAHTKQ